MKIKGKYSWIKHFDFMVIDLVSIFLAFLISYFMKFDNLQFMKNSEWTRYLFLILSLCIIIDFFVNPYSGIMRRSYALEIWRAFQLSIYNLMVTSLVFYAFKIGASYSREMSFYMYGIYFVLSCILKIAWKRLIVSGNVVVSTSKKIPLFVIGREKTISKTLRNVTSEDFQLYDIKGVHLIDGGAGSIDIEGLNNIPIIKDDYERYILDNNIVEVLVAAVPAEVEDGVLEKLNANGIGLNIVVDYAIGFQPEDQYIQNFGIYKALSVGAFSFTPAQLVYLAVKRVVDIICGLIGLVVLVPITLIVKLINLSSGDKEKIFYRQTRVGQNGKMIRIWKFRSMIPNADEVLQEMLKEEKWRKQWEENQKFDDDPRITKVGSFLRKTSIDELPQLLNVLMGDMSLVGPRPLVEGELEQHDGLKLYERVKPGITGWWGCNGRSNLDYKERLDLEYYYVKNCSISLDILCIVRTFLAVLKKDGAQ